jgi:MSHA biogenesis protein MshO
MPPDHLRRQHGFTLVEMIIVIVITGIIAAVVAVFIRKPVEGYFDTARRAQLTDIADTALRRIARDVHLALPNSVRTTDGDRTLEFLLTRTGGRYRAEPKSDGSGDVLDFTATDSSFDIIGPALSFAQGDRIVVYNLGPNVTGANAYAGDNITAYTGVPGARTNVTLAAFKFPLASPGNRFQVVEGPVSYACDLATGTLWRYWGYAIQASEPAAASLPGLAGSNAARLATQVTGCAFRYLEGVTERSGLLEMQLTLEDAGEKVSLYHTVHVSNVP